MPSTKDFESDLEEQVVEYDRLRTLIADLETKRKALGVSIYEKMEESKLEVGVFTVRRHQRLSIKLSLEEARELNAIELKEGVDKKKIKELVESGHQIEGVSDIQFIQVSKPQVSDS